MFGNLKTIRFKRLREEGGQALVTVMALMVIAGLTVPPVLAHISTTLKNDRVYDQKTEELYAADSGIEDGIWQVKYDRLTALFGTSAYEYDYDASCTYELDDPVNDLTANVTISTVWIPSNVPPPDDPAEAKQIIESNKLMIAGSAIDTSEYLIKINFYPEVGEEDQLMVDSLGIWLPHGFHYDGNCNLENNPGSTYYTENVSAHAGGEAVVWTFLSPVELSLIGDCTPGTPIVVDVTFDYTADKLNAKPVSISWVETSGTVSDILDVTWDIDTKMYRIVSVAENTEIEAYVARCELREMGDAIAGDYVATGNSLMTIDDDYRYREIWHEESSANISEIPEDADVIAAFLYWSGWYDNIPTVPIWTDNLSGFDAGSVTAWEVTSYDSRDCYGGDGNGGPSSTNRTLTMVGSVDLSGYDAGTVGVGWNQRETGNLDGNDELWYAFSGDDGATWSSNYLAFENDNPEEYFIATIPEDYVTDEFKLRFYLDDFNDSSDFAYLDGISVVELLADTTIDFEINGDRVYFDDEGDAAVDPWDTENITASRRTILENQPGQFSYACFRDVTKLVQAYSDLGEGSNRTGNGEYTVRQVDADAGVHHWAYAGWSIIVVYSSPDTAGHQLYLYDDFAWAKEYQNLDFDSDGQPGGSISGFVVPDPIPGEVNAAKLTCFVAEGDDWISGDELWFNSSRLSDGFEISDVWNSKSVGMSYDGVDVDTFYVTWASGLIEPGATTAELDLPTGLDNWNLIYIILSLRSETTVGGTEHYVIRSY